MLIYPIGTTEGCVYAAQVLNKRGIALTDHPSPEVTHLLLDVPSFQKDGMLRGGGSIAPLLRMLPEDITLIGGNLGGNVPDGYRCMDLLHDAEYQAQNAYITAECALKAAYPRMKSTFRDSPVLVIGWGRIGKCLARLLRTLGAQVSVAARNEQDRAMLRVLGYRTVDTGQLRDDQEPYDIIFNTVPYPVMEDIAPDTLAIELASVPGILDPAAIPALGLPGRYAPYSSGKLIANTIERLLKEE